MSHSMFTKRISLLFLTCFLFQSAYCQENYLAGYIVRLSGDTLHGFIDYRNWENNPAKISFKENPKSDNATYSPLTIKSFAVSDEVYQSAIVETEVSANNLDDLDRESKLKIKMDTVFLQTMIRGPKSLYYYFKKFGKPQFYIKRDAVYELLMYKKYIGRPLEVAENKRFIGQLTFYLQDCRAIQSKFKDLDYSKKSLENLFAAYYKSSNTNISFQKKTEKTKIQFGALVGLSESTLKFNHTVSNTILENSNFSQSVNFSTGLFLDFILPRNNNKLSIYNELVYTSLKVNGSYNNSTTAYGTINTYSTFEYSYLKIYNMVRYKYPVGKTFLFFNGGISSGFVIGGSNSQSQVTSYYNTTNVSKSSAIDQIRSFEEGYTFGLGTIMGRFSFDFRYERGSGITNYQELKSISERYYFLIGIRF